MLILAGDIGGTNTRLLLANVLTSGQKVLAEKSYLSAAYADLYHLIREFLSEFNISSPIDSACFAVAGPVVSGVSSITNLPWEIRELELSQLLKTSNVCLINDFAAVSIGISQLNDADVITIQQGDLDSSELIHCNKAVVGAGTGLGTSHMVWHNEAYEIYPSEAGHAGFTPESVQQSQLLSWLQKTHSHVSLEMLLSGRGLQTLYRFLQEFSGITESKEITQQMQAGDAAKIITDQALAKADELCQKTLNLFIEIYGAAAGNIALHYYPLGEVFIAGGIGAKIKDQLVGPEFTNAFVNKGLMTSNMQRIRVKLIVEEKVGLYGALKQAVTLIK